MPKEKKYQTNDSVVAGVVGDVPKQVEVILYRPPGNRARLIRVDTVREDRAESLGEDLRQYLIIYIKPVSYTHLTLPTKRIV